MEKNTVNLSLQAYHELREAPQRYEQALKDLNNKFEDLKAGKVVVKEVYTSVGRQFTHIVEEEHVVNVLQQEVDTLRERLKETIELLNKRSWWDKVFN